MVLEAALEEEFGNAKGSSAAVAGESKPAVWDWLADLDNADAVEAGEVQTRQVRRRRQAALLKNCSALLQPSFRSSAVVA